MSQETLFSATSLRILTQIMKILLGTTTKNVGPEIAEWDWWSTMLTSGELCFGKLKIDYLGLLLRLNGSRASSVYTRKTIPIYCSIWMVSKSAYFLRSEAYRRSSVKKMALGDFKTRILKKLLLKLLSKLMKKDWKSLRTEWDRS